MTDLSALALAIASQLDGTLAPCNDTVDGAPAGDDIAWINLANEREGLRVVLRRGLGVERTRVRATMSYTAELRGGADYRAMPDFYKLETAAAMSRGADVIARQIESKIVQPAIPLLESWMAKKAEAAAYDARLVAAVMRWRAAFPTAQIGKERDDSTEANFRMSGGGNNPDTYWYVNARLSPDGLYIDRMSRLPESAAMQLLQAMPRK